MDIAKQTVICDVLVEKLTKYGYQVEDGEGVVCVSHKSLYNSLSSNATRIADQIAARFGVDYYITLENNNRVTLVFE